MAGNDFPFPASKHEIYFQPAPAGIASSYTLGDIISGKVVLNAGKLEHCNCGVVYEMQQTVREMADQLAQNIPLDTPMMYGLSHVYDETASGLSQKEIADRLRDWHANHNK